MDLKRAQKLGIQAKRHYWSKLCRESKWAHRNISISPPTWKFWDHQMSRRCGWWNFSCIVYESFHGCRFSKIWNGRGVHVGTQTRHSQRQPEEIYSCSLYLSVQILVSHFIFISDSSCVQTCFQLYLYKLCSNFILPFFNCFTSQVLYKYSMCI